MAQRCAEFFGRCFGQEPQWVVAAPGRVNLIGEHTDYNDGYVLPMAIEQHMVIAAARNPQRQVTVHSITTGETATFNLRSVSRGEPAWSNYIRGVVAGFQQRGLRVSGFDAVIDSSLPCGGGLASSAALEVACATVLEAMVKQHLDPLEKALLCQRAEHSFAGVPCGIMDQIVSISGRADHALLLDCRSHQTTLLRLADPGVAVLILNTHVRHKLADGEYARRRAECEQAARILKVPTLRDATLPSLKQAQKRMPRTVFLRARHVLSENERTLAFARALQAGDWPTAGKLMYASHESLRGDYAVSCPELDAVVDSAKAIPPGEGMIGCRMTGAGFGGCAVSLVKTTALKPLIRRLEDAYSQKTSAHLSIFSTRPAGGAGPLDAAMWGGGPDFRRV